MSDQPGPFSRAEISNLIRQGVEAAPEGAVAPGLSDRWGAAAEPDVHSAHIQTSVKRARAKSYVPMLKPLRRLFRNQGAVNDSLIEAVHHLAEQNQELMERIFELRMAVAKLQRQPRAPASLESENAQDKACE